MNRKRPEPLAVPQERKSTFVLTNAGRFTEGDLTISKEGMMINSPSSSVGSEVPPKPSDDGEASTSDLTLADLEDLGVIGTGSSGVAKKVRNKHTKELLVLKVIQFDVGSDIIRKQVTTELRTLYGASNKHVVRYHQAFFDNGAITIAMEYMDEGSLADLLSKEYAHKLLPEKYIAAIARQVCAGLLHLHKELRVVHRDIKPSNLLLNSAGELKISDFGVSGQLTSSVSNCLSWVGTVTYMSPERIKGDSYSFDSDLWSLGLTLVECALGRFPYPPPGDAGVQLGFWELLEYIVMEAPPQLPRDQFSPEFCDFVSKCLQKDCKSRPSVQDMSKHAFLKLHKGTSLKDLLAEKAPIQFKAQLSPCSPHAKDTVSGGGQGGEGIGKGDIKHHRKALNNKISRSLSVANWLVAAFPNYVENLAVLEGPADPRLALQTNHDATRIIPCAARGAVS
eukprot:gene32719-3604_t